MPGGNETDSCKCLGDCLKSIWIVLVNVSRRALNGDVRLGTKKR